ncbi:MAG TPA: hypothetical protein VKG01_17700 [Thermoanaerobaculia bacterium]|nr:hypothetical protein [Thermoanaerobaculia bacterium]
MTRGSRAQAIVSAAGIAAVALFLVLVARFWHPVYGFTAFLQLDSSNDETKIAAFKEMPVYVYRDTGGYDGFFYAQIAYHPTLASNELGPAMDSLAYRGRRILAPVLARALALGNPRWIVHVYSLLNVAAWLALAAILWRMLPVRDARGWLAWAGVLFSAGSLSSVRLALPDLIALAILAGALLLLERGNAAGALGTLAMAGLARETTLAAVPGFWERPWLSMRNVVRTVIAAAPLAAWVAYVRWRVGPGGTGMRNLDWPLLGWIGKWAPTVAALREPGEHLLAWATLLAAIGLTVQAAFFVRHPRLQERWWRLGAAYVLLLVVLGPAVWEGFPGAATRVLLPLTLAFNVLACRERATVAWLLAGNLAIGAGLVAIKDVPRDPTELAAARAHGAAYVASLREGWYDRESEKRVEWFWSRGRSTVALEAWPKRDAAVRLEFALRGMSPRTVVVRQGDHELWRGEAGDAITSRQVVDIPLAMGRATIEFSSDAEPVREGPNPDARLLSFALYEPRIVTP